jgi:hypothetical protein
MSKHWKEPLDPKRHVDHHHAGGAHPRVGGAHEFAYFVRVAGFTFEFASLAQLHETLEFFALKIHPSSRRDVYEHEKGEWQAWHERLPAAILKGSRRERVLKALRKALEEFEPGAHEQASLTGAKRRKLRND